MLIMDMGMATLACSTRAPFVVSRPGQLTTLAPTPLSTRCRLVAPHKPQPCGSRPLLVVARYSNFDPLPPMKGSTLRPPRDTPVTFGSWLREAQEDRRPPPLLGSLKPKSLQWMISHLTDGEMQGWAELAAAVLADPVYLDRVEWTEYERKLQKDGAEAAVKYARSKGWVEMTDSFAWSGVNIEMLGTSLSKPIPRTTVTGTSPAASRGLPAQQAASLTNYSVPGVLQPQPRGSQTARRTFRRRGWLSDEERAQLARRDKRRKKREERLQGEGENEADDETGGRSDDEEDEAEGEELSRDWLLEQVAQQEEALAPRSTTGIRASKRGRKKESLTDESEDGEDSLRNESSKAEGSAVSPAKRSPRRRSLYKE